MSDLHEQLAKLMATENIDVIYSANAKTASFNLQTRVLTLPVYEDLPDECLSLLVYHEVGHALFTPLDATKDAYEQIANNDIPLFKNILNIVEDVRIEKLIQKKYPGTISIFRKGYFLFDQKDFFATKNRNKFSFLDRINLYFSLGMIKGKPILFTDDEAKIIARIDKSLDFSTTLQIAFDIFSFLKQKQQEQQGKQKQQNPQGQEKQQEQQNPQKQGQQKQQNQQGKQQQDNIKDNNYSDSSQTENSQNLPNGEKDDDSTNNNILKIDDAAESNKMTNESDNSDDDDITSCASKNNFAEQLKTNLMETYDNAEIKYFYIDDDEINYKDIIIDYKELYSLFDESEEIVNAKYGGRQEYYNDYINKLLHETKQTITSMAAAFEMKKQALLHVKDTTHYSGSVLDCNKLFQYKYNEDIFKKYNISYEGKNHGMVMFLDCSGSMRHTMKETLQQVLSLVLFCRKVNIPFEVYGFSSKFDIVSKTKAYKALKESRETYYSDDKINNIMFANVALKKYFSYKMSKAEFDNALWLFCYMIMGWDKELAYSYLPPFEYLDNTPLDSTILASKYIINDFKKETNAEIVNAIYLTDGDTSFYIPAIIKCEYKDANIAEEIGAKAYNAPKIIIRNKKTKDELVYSRMTYQQRYDGMTYLLYNLVKKDTGANIINIYLSPDKNTTYRVLNSVLTTDKKQEYNCMSNLVNNYNKNNIIILAKKDIKAFDSMFILRVKAFANVDPNNIAMSDNKKTYINNYAKVLGKRFSNRVFINSFTDIICKNII